MIIGVYIIKSPENWDHYTGSSGDCETRIKSHMAQLRSGRHSNVRLAQAYRRYGEKLEFYVIWTMSIESLLKNLDRLTDKEQEYMDDLPGASWNMSSEAKAALRDPRVAQLVRKALTTRIKIKGKDHPLYSVRQSFLPCNIHPDWLDHTTFVKWGISNGWQPGLHLIRLDGPQYSSVNCKFVTRVVARNQNRTDELHKFQGKMHSINAIADMHFVGHKSIRHGLANGLTLMQALDRAIELKNTLDAIPTYKYEGQQLTAAQIAKCENINRTGLKRQLAKGLSIEQSLKGCRQRIGTKSIKYSIDGELLSLYKIADKYKISRKTLRRRLDAGMRLREAIKSC